MFPSQETTYDSKYVASILSSMASGDSSASSNSYQMPNFLTSMATGGTGTTPTLTPTTLANLEQTFIELQSVPVDGSGAANGGCESHTQSGFVPPVVDMSSREQSMDSFCSDPEWEPGMKRGRDEDGELIMDGSGSQSGGPQRKYTRRSRNEKLTPEEDQRRRVRRERNKLAAAKCRQRRVDHTNSLVEETEKLEAERSDLESEIQSLQQEKDQLEFLLQAHVPICKVDAHGTFKVKTEPVDPTLLSSAAAACSAQSHLVSSYSSSSSCSSMTSSTPPSSSSSNSLLPASSTRPSSLALQDRVVRNGGDQQQQQQLPVVVSCAPIPLSTPSSGLFTYTSLDSLVEGSTGLTPLTEGHGALGGGGSTGLTPLTSGPGVSCASQMQRSENEGGSDAVSSPTLVSL